MQIIQSYSAIALLIYIRRHDLDNIPIERNSSRILFPSKRGMQKMRA
jgi:hypothetical protein